MHGEIFDFEIFEQIHEMFEIFQGRFLKYFAKLSTT